MDLESTPGGTKLLSFRVPEVSIVNTNCFRLSCSPVPTPTSLSFFFPRMFHGSLVLYIQRYYIWDILYLMKFPKLLLKSHFSSPLTLTRCPIFCDARICSGLLGGPVFSALPPRLDKDAHSSSSSLSDHCYLLSLQPPHPHPDPCQAHP